MKYLEDTYFLCIQAVLFFQIGCECQGNFMLLLYSNALLPRVYNVLWQVSQVPAVQSTPAVAISVFSFQFLLWLEHIFLITA